LGGFSVGPSSSTGQNKRIESLPKAVAPVPTGRPHLVGISSIRPDTSFQIFEQSTGELRKSGVLAPRNGEELCSVRGAFVVKSNAIEFLHVRIDNISYNIPPDKSGFDPAYFPDPETTPPAVLPTNKAAPTKSGTANGKANTTPKGR